jgi:D-alanyl-D-alanine carboxypeptidase
MNRIAAIVSRPEYVHARFGMEFWPLDAAKPAFRLNEQQFFIAASTTKLLTEGRRSRHSGRTRAFIRAYSAKPRSMRAAR